MATVLKLDADATRLEVLIAIAALSVGEALSLPDPETDATWTCTRMGDTFDITTGFEDRGITVSSISEALDWLSPVVA